MSEKNSGKKRMTGIRQKNIIITLVSAAVLCAAAVIAIVFQISHLTVPSTEEESTQETTAETEPQTVPVAEAEPAVETEAPGKFDSLEYYSATGGIQTVSELSQAGYVTSAQDYVPGSFTIGRVETPFTLPDYFSYRSKFNPANYKYTSIPAMRAYMDYFLCDDGRSINVLDSGGNIVAEGVDELTPVYQRDRNGNPLFTKDGKYYYIIEGTGTLAEVNFDPDFGTALSYSYSKADMENPAKLYRFYVDKEEIRLFSLLDGTDVTSFVNRVVELKGEEQLKVETERVPPYEKRVCDVRLWGYMDAAGNEVIQAQYYFASEFNADGYAFVTLQDGHMQMIDRTGAVVLDPYGRKFNQETNIDNLVVDGIYLPETFGEESIGMFRFDHGLMRVVRGLYDYYALGIRVREEDTLIYENGQYFAIPTGYKLCAYSDGVLLLERNGLYGYMDYTGKWITDPVFIYARPFYEGLAVAGNSSGQFCVIDTGGDIVLPMAYEYVTECVNGAFSAFSINDGWIIFNKMTAAG